jgi:glycosyltransferase involved in cell wall biosynthesis/peptidoglycan/xylan/chitin deacetylase (PgdA/CDA1 family)
MQVSVIIATFNRRRLLERTLPALLSQQFSYSEYEVIVVVDGSTDGTLEFLGGLSDHRNLRVIRQSNAGQAAAINAGIQIARGKFVLFLDDDILCGPDLVAQHARATRTDRDCLVFGPVFVSAEANDPVAVDWAKTFCDDFFTLEVDTAQELGWYGCLASANSSAPLQVINALGGLDESFNRKNDIEFGFRALEAGYRFTYQSDAVTHQIFEKTRRDVIEDARGEGAAEVRLCRKFPKLRSTSRFNTLASRPILKRLAIQAVSTFPFSLEPFLRPVVWLLAKLRGFPYFRRRVLSLFQLQQNIAAYRSAVREAGSWSALVHLFAAHLPVLMYHSIGPLRAGFDPYLTITPEMFEGDLLWLKKNGYSTIRTSDWIAYLREGKALREKPVLLTFDDAYRDTAEFGLPLLKKYGFTGAVFVVTDQIGGTNKWDLHLGISEMPLMTVEEIRDWAAQGIEFGAHSRSHPDLRSITDEQLTEELRGSRQKLEEILGTAIGSFAYPYGYLDDRAVEEARRHFDTALTCDIGLNSPSVDPLRMRRATIVPGYRLGARFGAVHFGFNVLLVARIQAGLVLKKLLGMPTETAS